MVNGLVPGAVLDRYEIQQVLATGGSGMVMRVRHVHLGSTHALKVLHVSSEARRERLLREGRIQAALRHPNIVGVTDVVPIAGGVALVMELVAGPDLGDWARRHRPDANEVDLVAEQLFAAVRCAHEATVVHRDLKPNNVLVERRGDDLVFRVADFGLAVALSEGGNRMTRTGQAMGTPRYMAPEQYADGRAADTRADIFALGAVLYEILAGRPAFQEASVIGAYTAAVSGGFIPLAEIAPGVPFRMSNAVESALRPHPADRPQTVETLRELWRAGSPPPPPRWSADAFAAASVPIPLEAVHAAATVDILGTPPEVAPPARSLAARWFSRGSLLGLGVASLVWGVAFLLFPDSDTEIPPAADAGSPAGEPSATEQALAQPPQSSPDAAPDPPTPPGPTQAAAPKATASKRSTGSVRVAGVERSQLIDNHGNVVLPSASLDPGPYKLEVWFDTEGPTQVLSLEVTAGSTQVVHCIPSLRVCR